MSFSSSPNLFPNYLESHSQFLNVYLTRSFTLFMQTPVVLILSIASYNFFQSSSSSLNVQFHNQSYSFLFVSPLIVLKLSESIHPHLVHDQRPRFLLHIHSSFYLLIILSPLHSTISKHFHFCFTPILLCFFQPSYSFSLPQWNFSKLNESNT